MFISSRIVWRWWIIWRIKIHAGMWWFWRKWSLQVLCLGRSRLVHEYRESNLDVHSLVKAATSLPVGCHVWLVDFSKCYLYPVVCYQWIKIQSAINTWWLMITAKKEKMHECTWEPWLEPCSHHPSAANTNQWMDRWSTRQCGRKDHEKLIKGPENDS
jgi:hypothetical protein